jgi:hypothetical protein
MKKKLTRGLFLVIAVALSCEPAPTDRSVGDHAISYLKWANIEYGLLIDDIEKVILDPNTFVFCSNGKPDKFFLVIRKIEGHIDVAYHGVDLDSRFQHFGENNTGVFLQGFHFEGDTNIWDNVGSGALQVFENFDDSYYIEGETGSVFYVLSYNQKIVVANAGEGEKIFEDFSKRLRNTIIDPVENIRKEAIRNESEYQK